MSNEKQKSKALYDVLRQFVRDIDSTGGLVKNERGYLVPAADRDWVDLALTYMDACEALGHEPKIAKG